MVTNTGIILAIAALLIVFIIFILLYTLLFSLLDSTPVIVDIIVVMGYVIVGLFFMADAFDCTTNRFRKPVDIIVFDERGNYICEYNEIEKVDETSDGSLKFEYNGRKHVIQNYSWDWSE